MFAEARGWNAIFVSHGNGDGRLTAELLCRGSSAPTRRRLWERARLRSISRMRRKESSSPSPPTRPGAAPRKAAFEEQIKEGRQGPRRQNLRPGRQQGLLAVQSTKIRNPAHQGCYVALQGDEARAFYRRRRNTARPARAVLHRDRRAGRHQGVGKDAIGLMGPRVIRSPTTFRRTRPFFSRRRFMRVQETRSRTGRTARCNQALMILFAAVEKAGSRSR